MSVLSVPEDWSGGLEDLVDIANALLPDVLPTDRSGRAKDEVNARLVRHYTTERLLDEPARVGREARYTRRHLLQLLALRKLMASGYGTSAVRGGLRSRSDRDLDALITGETAFEAGPNRPPRESALDYLRRIGEPVATAAILPEDLPLPSLPAPASASASVSEAPEIPSRYARLVIAPGVEVHVREGARLPGSPVERERLARALLDALDRLGRG